MLIFPEIQVDVFKCRRGEWQEVAGWEGGIWSHGPL